MGACGGARGAWYNTHEGTGRFAPPAPEAAMDAQYLFDSDGKWIAFRRGDYLFTPRGTWLGWFPWGDDYAVDSR